MRKTFFTAAAIAGLAAAGSLMPGRADAMTISTPAAAQKAVASLSDTVAYVCRRVRRCGYRGCYWHRACSWRPSYGYYHRWHRPYRPYRYGYRYYRYY
jgi:hypothetical protein